MFGKVLWPFCVEGKGVLGAAPVTPDDCCPVLLGGAPHKLGSELSGVRAVVDGFSTEV